jgi:two-component system response regulator RegA
MAYVGQANVDQILAAHESLLRGEAKEASNGIPQVPSLARVEWEHIQRVLADCGGNISQTAKMLGFAPAIIAAKA